MNEYVYHVLRALKITLRAQRAHLEAVPPTSDVTMTSPYDASLLSVTSVR